MPPKSSKRKLATQQTTSPPAASSTHTPSKAPPETPSRDTRSGSRAGRAATTAPSRVAQFLDVEAEEDNGDEEPAPTEGDVFGYDDEAWTDNSSSPQPDSQPERPLSPNPFAVMGSALDAPASEESAVSWSPSPPVRDSAAARPAAPGQRTSVSAGTTHVTDPASGALPQAHVLAAPRLALRSPVNLAADGGRPTAPVPRRLHAIPLTTLDQEALYLRRQREFVPFTDQEIRLAPRFSDTDAKSVLPKDSVIALVTEEEMDALTWLQQTRQVRTSPETIDAPVFVDAVRASLTASNGVLAVSGGVRVPLDNARPSSSLRSDDAYPVVENMPSAATEPARPQEGFVAYYQRPDLVRKRERSPDGAAHDLPPSKKPAVPVPAAVTPRVAPLFAEVGSRFVPPETGDNPFLSLQQSSSGSSASGPSSTTTNASRSGPSPPSTDAVLPSAPLAANDSTLLPAADTGLFAPHYERLAKSIPIALKFTVVYQNERYPLSTAKFEDIADRVHPPVLWAAMTFARNGRYIGPSHASPQWVHGAKRDLNNFFDRYVVSVGSDYAICTGVFVTTSSSLQTLPEGTPWPRYEIGATPLIQETERTLGFFSHALNLDSRRVFLNVFNGALLFTSMTNKRPGAGQSSVMAAASPSSSTSGGLPEARYTNEPIPVWDARGVTSFDFASNMGRLGQLLPRFTANGGEAPKGSVVLIGYSAARQTKRSPQQCELKFYAQFVVVLSDGAGDT